MVQTTGKTMSLGVRGDLISSGYQLFKTDIKLADISTNRLTSEVLSASPHKGFSDPLLNAFADKIQKSISFGVGRTNLANDAPTDHPLFLDQAWYSIPNSGHYRDELREKARKQLGTVGSGNHYVDVFVDKADDHIWVGAHFGSRGLGHTIASNFLAIGQGGTWGDKGKEVETLLNLQSPAGQEYWALMELAGKYAYVGREWVARKVVAILGGKEVDLVHNHHNFAWKEKQIVNGKEQELIVIRKGATPAFPGQRGFIGGSMGDDAVIITGSSNPVQKAALYSTVHGAGRVMSRTEAAGKRNFRTGQLLKDKNTGEIVNPGKVSPAMMSSWIKNFGTVLRGGGLDESPHVYLRLTDVLSAQKETITVTNVLRPVIVVMAGANEFDPYKD